MAWIPLSFPPSLPLSYPYTHANVQMWCQLLPSKPNYLFWALDKVIVPFLVFSDPKRDDWLAQSTLISQSSLRQREWLAEGGNVCIQALSPRCCLHWPTLSFLLNLELVSFAALQTTSLRPTVLEPPEQHAVNPGAGSWQEKGPVEPPRVMQMLGGGGGVVSRVPQHLPTPFLAGAKSF